MHSQAPDVPAPSAQRPAYQPPRVSNLGKAREAVLGARALTEDDKTNPQFFFKARPFQPAS